MAVIRDLHSRTGDGHYTENPADDSSQWERVATEKGSVWRLGGGGGGVPK